MQTPASAVAASTTQPRKRSRSSNLGDGSNSAMETGGGNTNSNSVWSFEMSDHPASADEENASLGPATMTRTVDDSAIGAAAGADSDGDYDFATHVVKVKRSGQVVDVSSLWDDVEGIYKFNNLRLSYLTE